MTPLVCHSRSAADTERLGQLLAPLLDAGAFLALRGELGGGKTCFTRGLVAGLAPENLALVASPTFAIMNHYPGPLPVYHFDFYRLSGDDEIAELGFEEYLQGAGICIVEWAERLHALLPDERLEFLFCHEDDDRRRIEITASGETARKVLERLAALIDAENFL